MLGIVIAIISVAFLAFYFFLEVPRQNSIDEIKDMNCEELWDRITNQAEATGNIGDYTLSAWISKECWS